MDCISTIDKKLVSVLRFRAASRNKIKIQKLNKPKHNNCQENWSFIVTHLFNNKQPVHRIVELQPVMLPSCANSNIELYIVKITIKKPTKNPKAKTTRWWYLKIIALLFLSRRKFGQSSETTIAPDAYFSWNNGINQCICKNSQH
jgi:hypothetical protein